MKIKKKSICLKIAWFPKLSDVDKTKPKRKTVSSLHLAITTSTTSTTCNMM